MKIPLSRPMIGEEEINSVSMVLKSGWLAHGPKTKAFEQEFASYTGTKFATSLNSCASALQIAIQAQNLKGEIICPSFSMSATANAILVAGCTPVFADVEWDSCNIAPEKVRELVSDKTAAIMPVHFAGQSCKMDEVMEIAEAKGLKVIEDSAEAIGAEFRGQKTGSFGIGCFSFYPTKNITTGEGGMITTDDEAVYTKAKALKAHGISSTAIEREQLEKPWLRDSTEAGYNMRMCDVLAAIGLEQLKKVDEMNKLRRMHADFFNKSFEQLEEIEVPAEQPNCKHVYQMYTIKLGEKIDRTKFVSLLREKEIGASVHFDPPIHAQSFYKKLALRTGSLKVTEKLSQRIVTLPMFPGLKQEELEFIAENVETVLKQSRK